MFWENEIESIDSENLRKLQLGRLKKTLKIASQTPFYKKRFNSINFDVSKLTRLSQIKEIPFTTKDDLRSAYPNKMNDPIAKMSRIHSSSGTTGQATVIFYTKKDIQTWADLVSRNLYMIGMREGDVFQNMMGYGLFTGGLGLHYGAENLGALVIPAGGGNSQKQISLMKDFNTDFLHITPSYALHIADELEKIKINPASLGLKGLIVGAEPHSNSIREKIETIYQAPVFNSYGLSEMNGPGVGFECSFRKDIHIWEDNYIVEIINPKTGEYVKDGEKGELVLTTINREGMPIIRYRTKDLTYKILKPCECGRGHTRIARIIGRSDDLMIIKGINVYPSQIEHVLMEIPEVGNNYQIEIRRSEDHLDSITVNVEIYGKIFHGQLKELKTLQKKIQHKLKEEILIKPEVNLLEPGSLPPSEGKAKRVIDLRKI